MQEQIEPGAADQRAPRTLLRWFVIACAIAASHAAFAQAADRACINNMVGVDAKTVSLYEIEATAPTHFVHGGEAGNCPGTDGACQAKAYLVKGNQVVVMHNSGEYACATFVAARKGKAVASTGWLPLSALKAIETAPRWTGHWISNDRDATIDIVAKDGATIGLTGEATWSSNAMNGQSGAFGAVVSPRANFVSFADGDNLPPSGTKSSCTLRIAQLGSYLVVSDNNECGGSNISFSSVYVRHE